MSRALRVAWLLVAFVCALACVRPRANDDDDGAIGARRASVRAPGWALAPLAAGTWEETLADGTKVTRAWADAKVANLRFHKRVLVRVRATYDDGRVIDTLHPAAFETVLGDGERWGTDAIEIHATLPDGARLVPPVIHRFSLQHDLDGEGRDEMIETEWTRLHGTGAVVAPAIDRWSGLDSPRHPTSTPPTLDVWFPPFDDAGAIVLREIRAVVEAKRKDPSGRHTVHSAIFNLDDRRIVDALVEAHRAGVEVRLVTDAKKLRPSSAWLTGDDVLLAAGVPLIGVGRPGTGAMHLKVALFDGRKVATGSFNWEHGSSFENHENMVLTDDPALVDAYAQRFEILAGGVHVARSSANDLGARVSAHFGPDEAPHRAVAKLIRDARTSVHVAMFTAKDFEWDESGRKVSIFRELIAAKKRGLDVLLVTDAGVAEGAEYHGVTTPDDQTDELLEAAGIQVVRADNTFATYASMHHKIMVIDGEVAVTGALNWYWDAAMRNDEDVLVVRDRALALRFTGEIVDLVRRYDEGASLARFPKVDVAVSAHHDDTQWGEQLVLLGDLPQLGAWDSSRAIVLEGSRFPEWRATLVLPVGVRARCKLAVRRRDGTLSWERGEDRILTALATTVPMVFRR